MKVFLRFLLLAVSAVGIIILALWLTQPRLSAVEINPDGSRTPAVLPWHFEGATRMRQIEVRFHDNMGFSNVWQIVPDDEMLGITANGHKVSLAEIPPGALHDWSKGFVIDLDSYLVRGENVLTLQIGNEGGPGGVHLRPRINKAGILLFGIGFALLLSALNQLIPLAREQNYIILLGLVVLLAYWIITPWEIRSHDVGLPDGHFGYATWIADHMTLPRPNQGWTFYHPPLYYMIAALILRAADFLHIGRPESLQIFSLMLWMVFLVASAATLRMCLRGRHVALLIATSMLVLWPSCFIHSIRIGNDTPAYACCALAALFMIRWWKTHRTGSLVAFALWSAVALLCKTSSIAIVVAGAALLSWRMIFPGHEGHLRAVGRTALFGGITATGLVLSLGNNIYHYMRHELSGWLVGNAGSLSDGLRVPLTIKSFIPLDIPTFLTAPYASAWEDATGRANFWNYLLRDSLTGEFGFDGTTQRFIAFCWGVALLVLCCTVCIYLVRLFCVHCGTTLYRMRPLLLLSFLWLASLIVLRIQIPYACSSDFRYILPILLPAAVIVVNSGRTARALAVAISLMSVYFFATLQS